MAGRVETAAAELGLRDLVGNALQIAVGISVHPHPEIERRAQEVIDRCWQMGERNPVLLIHDVGAGGLSNAIPEAVDHSKHGAQIELREIANAERGMSPMAIWCNEAQERYVLIVAAERVDEFKMLCERERCPVSVIGALTENEQLIVNDCEFDNRIVDMPMSMLLGNPPKLTREVARVAATETGLDLSGIALQEAALRVLRYPAVADNSFLIHIGDRSVGGLSARDQLVGPWQVPVSDVAITLAYSHRNHAWMYRDRSGSGEGTRSARSWSNQ